MHYSYIGFLLLSLLSLRYIRKIGLVHMLVLITFTIMSLASLRYLIFYMCVAAPILARVILYVKEEKYINGYFRGLKSREGLLSAIPDPESHTDDSADDKTDDEGLSRWTGRHSGSCRPASSARRRERSG